MNKTEIKLIQVLMNILEKCKSFKACPNCPLLEDCVAVEYSFNRVMEFPKEATFKEFVQIFNKTRKKLWIIDKFTRIFTCSKRIKKKFDKLFEIIDNMERSEK